MIDEEPNPFASRIIAQPKDVVKKPGNVPRLCISLGMILVGIIVGPIGIALVSNQYGNTDIYGLPVVGVGGMTLCTGICNLFMKFRYAVIVGIAAAPASVIFLFIMYWAWIIVVAAIS